METKLVKNLLFVFFFLNYFLDLILYKLLNFAGEAGYYYLFYLVIVEQPYYTGLIVSFPVLLIIEIASRSTRQWKTTLLFFFLFIALDGSKLLFLNYHPYLPFMVFSKSAEEIEKEKRQELGEKRRTYRKEFLEKAPTEDPIFANDRLDSEFVINEPLGNYPIRYGKSERVDLNRIYDVNFANRLSFSVPISYDTEYAKTKYNEIMEYRTKEGNISFFLLDGKVQNCIYDSGISEKGYVFLQGCHKKESFYDAFWSSVIHTYCPQRNSLFRKTNECDSLR